MLYIDGMLIQEDVMTILKELKFQLAVNGTILFSTMKDTNDNIMITCPMHKNGQERSPSCGVHKKTGLVHCFTCGYSVTLSEMISNVFGRNDCGIFGREWLRKNFTEIAVEERDELKLNLARKSLKHEFHSYVPDIVLEQYRYTHPYMYKRGLTDDVIDKFDIGYDIETECLTFPVRDKNGNCLFVARRSVKDKYFHYPSGAHKPLYGVYEMDSISPVYVCESMFNALSLVTIGCNAVALNGTGSKEQYEELRRLPNRHIILALDNDEAGNRGMNKIANYLKDSKILYSLSYKDSRDINDLLLDRELEELVSTVHLYFS